MVLPNSPFKKEPLCVLRPDRKSCTSMKSYLLMGTMTLITGRLHQLLAGCDKLWHHRGEQCEVFAFVLAPGGFSQMCSSVCACWCVVLTPWVGWGPQVWSQRTVWPPHTGRCKLAAEWGPAGTNFGKCTNTDRKNPFITHTSQPEVKYSAQWVSGLQNKQLLHMVFKGGQGQATCFSVQCS